MSRPKNTTLELLKLFTSYMVVLVHVPFPGTLGTVVNSLARFAIPLFLAVAGFYSYGITPEQILRRIRSLLRLLLLTKILYIAWAMLSFGLKGDSCGMAEYFMQYLQPEKLRELLLFNLPVHDDHLWYIFAAIYVYLLFYFAVRLRLPDRCIFVLSAVLLISHLVLWEAMSRAGAAVPNHLFRNFLFMGIPLFSAGLFARKYVHVLTGLPAAVIPALLAVGISGTLISFGASGIKDLYLGSLFVAAAAIITALKYEHVTYPSVLQALTGCSTGVYIMHRIVSAVFGKVYGIFGVYAPFPDPVRFVHSLLTCIGSTVAAYGLVWASKKIKERKLRKAAYSRPN